MVRPRNYEPERPDVAPPGSLRSAEQVPLVSEFALIGAFQRTTAAITSSESIPAILHVVLNICVEELGRRFASIAILDTHSSELVLRVTYPPHIEEMLRQAEPGAGVPHDTIYRLDMHENLMVRVYLEESPRITTSLVDVLRPHPTAGAAAGMQRQLGIGALAVLPLVASGRCLGVLTVASGPPHASTEADLPVLKLFAGQVALALENARLRQDLRDREHQVSLLLKATIDAQEEERERICLEIHDGVAQTLAPAFHYLQAVQGRSELSNDLQTNIRRASSLVRDAIREAREVIASLRPATLDALGLMETLRYELEGLRDQMGWEVDCDFDPVRFPKPMETALYRILHEAINNVAKHARAKRVAVSVKQDHEHVIAEIQDDGIGFDVASVNSFRGAAAPNRTGEYPSLQRQGVGLLSMHKRTELLQGSFDVLSTPGAGTRVRLAVPLHTHEGLTATSSGKLEPQSPSRADGATGGTDHPAEAAADDTTTDLLDLSLLSDSVQQAIRDRSPEKASLALLVLGLYDARGLSDTAGQRGSGIPAPEVLVRLRSLVRESDTVTVLGRNRFAALLPVARDAAHAAIVAERILKALQDPLLVDRRVLRFRTSIGISLYPEHGTDAEALVHQANAAMGLARTSGAGYAFYSSSGEQHGPLS